MKIPFLDYVAMVKELKRLADFCDHLQPFLDEYFKRLGVVPPQKGLKKEDRETEVLYVDEEEGLLREIKHDLNIEDDDVEGDDTY